MRSTSFRVNCVLSQYGPRHLGALPSKYMASPTTHSDLLVSAPGGFAVLVSRIGQQRFALPASAVERILPMAALTPLADAPSGVVGILDVRGEVLPVINPRPRLGLDTPPLLPEQHLVLTAAGTRFLVWLDRAESLVQVPGAAIDRVEAREERPLVSGVVRMADGTVPVLSPEALDPGAIIRNEMGGRT